MASKNLCFTLLSNSVTHLGRWVSYNLKDKEDILRAINDLNCKANSVLYTFSYTDMSTLCFLIKTYCLSLYGCTRGLLEKATGICTGFIYCDTVMRVHGYVGERIKSGKVLVVKTRSPVTKWRLGGNNTQSEPVDSSYAAAVYIL